MTSQDTLSDLYRELEGAQHELKMRQAMDKAMEEGHERKNPDYRIRKILREIEAAKGPRLIPQYYSVSKVADLAPLIRKARKQMKMNQQQFADAAGVGRRFLSELENGKPSLEFDKVLACALAAGIDIMAKPRRPL